VALASVALVAARQPPPAAELGEGVLDRVERRDRPKADLALRRSLDFEPQVAAIGQGAQVPIAAVGDDRSDARQTGQAVTEQVAPGPDRVRLGGISTGAHRRPEDLDEDRPLGTDRPTTSPAGIVERRAVTSALDGLGIDHDHRGDRGALVADPDELRQRVSARSQTPFARQRRHCCQTAPPGPKRSGR
jgi:hypothetical protein